MKVEYFPDTDTLYIELSAADIVETRDLDENTLIDLDAAGNVCALTFEHAAQRGNLPSFSFEQVFDRLAIVARSAGLDSPNGADYAS